MEKLGQLHRDAARAGTYDLIVVDTPPSRSALDFLDAPERLSSFLDGRFIRLLLAPARGPARLMTAGLGHGHRRADQGPRRASCCATCRPSWPPSTRCSAGSGQRAQQTYRAAAGRRHGVPRRGRARDRTRCARRRTSSSGSARTRCRWRAWSSTAPAAAGRARSRRRRRWPRAARLVGRRGPDGPRSTAGLLRLHADRRRLVEREAVLRSRFAAAHPQVPTAVVPALAGDVHDLDGLRRVGVLLGGQDDRHAAGIRLRPRQASDGRRPAFTGDAAPERAVSRTARHLAFGLRLQEGPALALGHPTPDAPLDLVLEGLGQALGLHRAPGAELLGLVLLGSTHEQLVGLAEHGKQLGLPILHST